MDTITYIAVVNLLLGYNLVDDNGNVIRKQTFVINYPDKAKKLVKEVYYPKYADMASEETFPYYDLNREIYNCIGFCIVRARCKMQ